MKLIEQLTEKILAGGQITDGEAYALAMWVDKGCEEAASNREALHEGAARITRHFCNTVFDTCSIVNARSGRCPENCKWCAQSAHFKTKCDIYPLISHDECMAHADMSRTHHIGRFSMVTSGRKMTGAELDRACEYYSELATHGDISLCASMGLLDRDELRKLRLAGVTRYHCNLEAAPDHFSTLCTTHTVEDKIQTILAAKELGFEVCSGGIIGMGESVRQRVGLALELRRVDPVSIPINILCPIPGTPLENSEPLSEDEIIDAVALFRYVHPKVTLRFAGGRASLSREGQLRAIRTGINGAIVGDLLTTVGSTVNADRTLIAEAGLTFGTHEAPLPKNC